MNVLRSHNCLTNSSVSSILFFLKFEVGTCVKLGVHTADEFRTRQNTHYQYNEFPITVLKKC